jgi:hypothetical protein
MEEQELKDLWRSYDKKLDTLLEVNFRQLKELQTQKAKTKINSFVINQVVGIILGVIWIGFLFMLVYYSLGKNIYFTVSVALIGVFNVIAVAAYIRHVIMIKQININDNITEAQKKLAKVQSSFNNVGRFLILQTPFYCTFYLSNEMILNGDATFWIIQIPVTLFFTFISIWLYKNLTYENIHKKWVRIMMDSFGGKTMRKAMEFLKEIEDFKKVNG